MIDQTEATPSKIKNSIKLIFSLLILVFAAALVYFLKENNFSPNELLSNNQAEESYLGKILDDGQEVEVLPIVIEDQSTPETEERAQEFTSLKEKSPIEKENFSINFSYGTNAFDVFVAKGQEDQFWNWLATNYPSLDGKSFRLVSL